MVVRSAARRRTGSGISGRYFGAMPFDSIHEHQRGIFSWEAALLTHGMRQEAAALIRHCFVGKFCGKFFSVCGGVAKGKPCTLASAGISGGTAPFLRTPKNLRRGGGVLRGVGKIRPNTVRRKCDPCAGFCPWFCPILQSRAREGHPR